MQIKKCYYKSLELSDSSYHRVGVGILSLLFVPLFGGGMEIKMELVKFRQYIRQEVFSSVWSVER